MACLLVHVVTGSSGTFRASTCLQYLTCTVDSHGIDYTQSISKVLTSVLTLFLWITTLVNLSQAKQMVKMHAEHHSLNGNITEHSLTMDQTTNYCIEDKLPKCQVLHIHVHNIHKCN